jgi:hypothetical protein
MKVKVRSDDASTLRKHGWPQAGDWLAGVRDSSRAEPPGDGHADADGAEALWPGALAQADAFARARARAACGYPPASRTELEWHHDFPAVRAMPVGWSAVCPPGASVLAAWP